jgi:hypothetical protein
MKDIRLPEFGNLEDFIDLHDIVASHVRKDALWAKELEKMTDSALGQVQIFVEHPIRAQTMLQQLNAILVKYRAHAVEIKGFYAAPME